MIKVCICCLLGSWRVILNVSIFAAICCFIEGNISSMFFVITIAVLILVKFYPPLGFLLFVLLSVPLPHCCGHRPS
jgi:hypothetical protein